jgi:RteC protein
METKDWSGGAHGELWDKMEAELEEVRQKEGEECYSAMMRVVKRVIREMRVERGLSFTDGAEEVAFFRDVWPRFYGRLFYYFLLSRFERDRVGLSSENAERLIRQEEREITRFFVRHREWWYQYRHEPDIIASQFTTGYSELLTLDPWMELFDLDWVTAGSYRAAWGIAYEEYQIFLGLERERLAGAGIIGPRWEWKESKTAAVELLKAQVEIGSIYIDGKPATFVQLRADFEGRYGVKLDTADKLLYATDTRKIEDMPYLGKLMRGFMGRKERLGK